MRVESEVHNVGVEGVGFMGGLKEVDVGWRREEEKGGCTRSRRCW